MVYTIETHRNWLLAVGNYNANDPNLERFPLTDCFQKLKKRCERTANDNYDKTTRTPLRIIKLIL